MGLEPPRPDLFFAYDALHRSSMERRRRVDFYGDPIHILSAEDLIVYKAAFNRSKDWDDIAGMILASPEPLDFDFDFDYARRWLERIDDTDRHRLSRLEGLIATGGIEVR